MAKTIYIIDDDKDIVEATKIVLEAKGYSVKTALTIEDGKKLVDEEKPNLILLDVMFPGGEQDAGFIYCRDLRTNEKTKDIPVIMFTAVNKDFPFHFDKDADWLPADEFLNKPVDNEELLEKVQHLIG